ncbi:MAG: hypothetical protein RMZ41_016735 [Nostoc sp. DedVER02]|uniref:hypothetical protein n=1 Tax=unclassified Nostoc TaxID=2593658 RepID=UPI002AD28CA1|nr:MULTISPECIES: hypothetical protein [unclassified Nostoc]MDZ7986149.1 hypothetical protein [Nostoc sp. DedVER02]MDZ8115042.1 hypothetical protein [Nostoc sp. DedVER01b]
MSRKKRTSRVLEKAELRSSGLKAIDTNLDFGDVCNLKNMTGLIEKLRAKIDALNMALIVVDSSRAEIEELEQSLSSLSEKMLMGVAFKYGKDSREYEMAGGVRTSERVRRSRLSRLKNLTHQASGESAQVTKTVLSAE